MAAWRAFSNWPCSGAAGILECSEAKIENLGLASLGCENVCRLDVALDDSSGVSCVESIGDFRRACQRYFRIERPALNGVLERRAVQKLHGDKRLALRLAHPISRADIRVIEGPSGARLSTESFKGLRVVGKLGSKKLERYPAAKGEESSNARPAGPSRRGARRLPFTRKQLHSTTIQTLAPIVVGSESPHERRSGFRLRAPTPARRLNLRLQW